VKNPVSKFAFQVHNLQRYIAVGVAAAAVAAVSAVVAAVAAVSAAAAAAGRCRAGTCASTTAARAWRRWSSTAVGRAALHDMTPIGQPCVVANQ
jgi:putative flippase GtrA